MIRRLLLPSSCKHINKYLFFFFLTNTECYLIFNSISSFSSSFSSFRRKAVWQKRKNARHHIILNNNNTNPWISAVANYCFISSSVFPFCGLVGIHGSDSESTVLFTVDVSSLCGLDAHSGRIPELHEEGLGSVSVRWEAVVVEVKKFAILS